MFSTLKTIVLNTYSNLSTIVLKSFSKLRTTVLKMFSKLLKSTARKKILQIFLKDSRQSYYLRELAVAIEYSPGSLQRELNGLITDGLLISQKMGNLRFFSLNAKSPYLRDLKLYIDQHAESAGESGPKKSNIDNAKKADQKKEKQEVPTHPTTHVDIQSTIQSKPHIATDESKISNPSPISSIPSPPPSTPFSNLNLPAFSKPVLTKPHLEKPILEKPPVNIEIHIDQNKSE